MPSAQSVRTKVRVPSSSSKPSGISSEPSGIVPRLLSVKEASAYSGATIWAIRQLYWSKEISGTIIGRRLLISRESLDALIDRKLAVRAGGAA
jgi:hypothetical protein